MTQGGRWRGKRFTIHFNEKAKDRINLIHTLVKTAHKRQDRQKKTHRKSRKGNLDPWSCRRLRKVELQGNWCVVPFPIRLLNHRNGIWSPFFQFNFTHFHVICSRATIRALVARHFVVKSRLDRRGTQSFYYVYIPMTIKRIAPTSTVVGDAQRSAPIYSSVPGWALQIENTYLELAFKAASYDIVLIFECH